MKVKAISVNPAYPPFREEKSQAKSKSSVSHVSHPKIKELSREQFLIAQHELQIWQNNESIHELKDQIQEAAYWSSSKLMRIGFLIVLVGSSLVQKTLTWPNACLALGVICMPRKKHVCEAKWKELEDIFLENAQKKRAITQLESLGKKGKRHKKRGEAEQSLKGRVRDLSQNMKKKAADMKKHKHYFNDYSACPILSELGGLAATAFLWSGACYQLISGSFLNKTPELVKGLLAGAVGMTGIVSGAIILSLTAEELIGHVPLAGPNISRKEGARQAWEFFNKAAVEHAALRVELEEIQQDA